MQSRTFIAPSPVVPTCKATKPRAGRRSAAIRAYVVEKDLPPQQAAGGAPEKIRVGINGAERLHTIARWPGCKLSGFRGITAFA